MTNTILIKKIYKSIKAYDKVAIINQADSVLLYLNNFSSNLKTNGLLNRILEIKWLEKDQVERDKALVQAAKNYISYLINQLQNGNDHDKAFIDTLETTIADLFQILKRLDTTLEDFILLSTNNQLTSIQFKHLECLFYHYELPKNLTRYELDHLTVPYLRTILESKIKKILGIDIIRDSNGTIDTSKILEILFDLNYVELNKAFKLQLLKLIMKWLNHFMHRNLRPEPYILHAVIEYLKPIFTPGEKKFETHRILSVNISAYVADVDLFQSEIETKIKQKYPDCFIGWTSKEVSTSRINSN